MVEWLELKKFFDFLTEVKNASFKIIFGMSFSGKAQSSFDSITKWEYKVLRIMEEGRANKCDLSSSNICFLFQPKRPKFFLVSHKGVSISY